MISIHALGVESDKRLGLSLGKGDISIHALREESDVLFAVWYVLTVYFNPRSP